MGFAYVREAEYKCRDSGIQVPEPIIDAMNRIDRRKFVPPQERNRALNDWAIPIIEGQTTSAPHMIMMMLATAEIKAGDKVLEIGTGSGYNTAILSMLVGEKGKVISIERKKALVEFAEKNLEKFPLSQNFEIRHADGTKGLDGEIFHKILVTAVGPFIPAPLCWQLEEWGIMIIPVQKGPYQYLLKVTRLPEGETTRVEYLDEVSKYPPLEIVEITSVRFVKLIGEFGFKD